MTRDDIIRMAREAGWKDLREFDSEMRDDIFMGKTQDLERFATLVAEEVRGQTIESEKRGWLHAIDKMVAAEREACAKLCDLLEEQCEKLGLPDEKWPTPADCAAVIRARGENT